MQLLAGSSNGRTWAFEAQYLGSSPSPAANKNKIEANVITKPSIQTVVKIAAGLDISIDQLLK